jgi:competence protein ComFC
LAVNVIKNEVLSAEERKINGANAFCSVPDMVFGKSILLMDDFATTGATLSSCADTLLNAGASTVFALTLARALPHHGLQVV